MSNANLFLKVILKSNDQAWYKAVEARLADLESVEHVQIVKADASIEAQIALTYSLQRLSLNKMEGIVQDMNAEIVYMSISLEPAISGAADPYSASAIAIPLQDELEKLYGVIAANISPHGMIKIELDPKVADKQNVLTKLLIEVFQIRIEH